MALLSSSKHSSGQNEKDPPARSAHSDSREGMMMVTEMEQQLSLFPRTTFSFFPVVEDQLYAIAFYPNWCY